jgi:hypothetical protein
MQLFPFLAVLICAMGALIVVLVLVVKHARVKAETIADQRVQEQHQQKQGDQQQLRQAEEDLQWQQEVLTRQRQELTQQLAKGRLELSHLEDHIRRVEQKFAELTAQAQEMQRLGTGRHEDATAAQGELQQLQTEIEQQRQRLEESRAEVAKRRRSYAIIPYRGPNGTERRPIYIECRASGIYIQPGGIVLTPDDLAGPLGPGNPLDAALRAIREHWAQAEGSARGSEPYPLLIVRPDGAVAYSIARAAMTSWEDEFGYELVGDDMDLAYPPSDPALKRLAETSIQTARQRQAILMAAMPRRFQRNVPPERSPGPNGVGDGSGAALPGTSGAGLGGTRGADVAGSGSGLGSGGQSGTGAGGVPASHAGALPGNGLARDGAPTAFTGAGPTETGTGAGSGRPRGLLVGIPGGGGTSLPGSGAGSAPGTAAGIATSSAGFWPGVTGGTPGTTAGGTTGAGVIGGGRSGTREGMSGDADVAACRPGASANGGGVPASGSSTGGTGRNGGPSGGTVGFQLPPDAPPKDGKGIWVPQGKVPDATGITRPIFVDCYPDRLVIQPDRGSDRPPQEIPVPGTLRASQGLLSSALRGRIERWGIAVVNGYWKPVLKVKVHPGAEPRFDELKRLLENSGYDVERREESRRTARAGGGLPS